MRPVTVQLDGGCARPAVDASAPAFAWGPSLELRLQPSTAAQPTSPLLMLRAADAVGRYASLRNWAPEELQSTAAGGAGERAPWVVVVVAAAAAAVAALALSVALAWRRWHAVVEPEGRAAGETAAAPLLQA